MHVRTDRNGQFLHCQIHMEVSMAMGVPPWLESSKGRIRFKWMMTVRKTPYLTLSQCNSMDILSVWVSFIGPWPGQTLAGSTVRIQEPNRPHPGSQGWRHNSRRRSRGSAAWCCSFWTPDESLLATGLFYIHAWINKGMDIYIYIYTYTYVCTTYTWYQLCFYRQMHVIVCSWRWWMMWQTQHWTMLKLTSRLLQLMLKPAPLAEWDDVHSGFCHLIHVRCSAQDVHGSETAVVTQKVAGCLVFFQFMSYVQPYLGVHPTW